MKDFIEDLWVGLREGMAEAWMIVIFIVVLATLSVIYW